MEADINAVISCVKQQRNDGLDAVAMLNGVIASLRVENEKLAAELKELKEGK